MVKSEKIRFLKIFFTFHRHKMWESYSLKREVTIIFGKLQPVSVSWNRREHLDDKRLLHNDSQKSSPLTGNDLAPYQSHTDHVSLSLSLTHTDCLVWTFIFVFRCLFVIRMHVAYQYRKFTIKLCIHHTVTDCRCTWNASRMTIVKCRMLPL